MLSKTLILSFGSASAAHAIVLLGFNGTSHAELESDALDRIELVAEDPTEEPEIETPSEEIEEAEALLPDEFLAPELAEPAPASLGSEAITQLVKIEPMRLPKPNGRETIGIPTGAQRKSGGQIASGIFSLSELDRPPRTRTERMPHYPPALRNQKVPGDATLLIVVDRSGRVVSAQIEQATHPDFGRASYTAALKWRFEPGLRNGKPVPFRVRLPFEFTP